MPLIFAKPLPGKPAQLEMASESRAASLREESSQPPGAVDAAVLVLLTPVNAGQSPEELLEWNVLLIRRNSYPGAHSGQIAFPGGRREASDNSLCDAACREAREEAGINRERLTVIGPLTSLYVPPSNFIMHPFLAVNKEFQPVRLDSREAVDYRNIPVREFDPGRAVRLEFDYPDGQRRPAPAWRIQGFTIWGATAMILAELRRMVKDEALAAGNRP